MHHRRASASVNEISANISPGTTLHIMMLMCCILTREPKINSCGYKPLFVYVSANTKDIVKIDILPKNKANMLKIDHSDFD